MMLIEVLEEIMLDDLRQWHAGLSLTELTQNTRGRDLWSVMGPTSFGRARDDNEDTLT